jgi:hypothetical protein
MEKNELSIMADQKGDTASISTGVDNHPTIYIDPEKEKAVMRKFDKYLLPQAFIFLLLNYLDRSNLGRSSHFCSLMYLSNSDL